LIREHRANSAWWGERVGILADPAFFSLGRSEQVAVLADYAWVEFKAPLKTAPPAHRLLEAQFAWVDAQIEFRIGLAHVPSSPSLDPLQVKFADEEPFTIDAGDLKPFVHERFLELPGITPAKLHERYARWARQLVAEQPDSCLEIKYQSQCQGWFLSRRGERGLNLTLAMLHKEATISGMHLYQKALIAYAGRGQRVGWASFSVGNVSVHNIYARLGAQFTPPVGCWLWVNRRANVDSVR
jgi:hypothetical protein